VTPDAVTLGRQRPLAHLHIDYADAARKHDALGLASPAPGVARVHLFRRHAGLRWERRAARERRKGADSHAAPSGQATLARRDVRHEQGRQQACQRKEHGERERRLRRGGTTQQVACDCASCCWLSYFLRILSMRHRLVGPGWGCCLSASPTRAIVSGTTWTCFVARLARRPTCWNGRACSPGLTRRTSSAWLSGKHAPWPPRRQRHACQQQTSAHRALSTRLGPMHCVCTGPTQRKMFDRITRPMRRALVRRLGSVCWSACSRVARYRATTPCSVPTTARATPTATPSSTGACDGLCRPWRRRQRYELPRLGSNPTLSLPSPNPHPDQAPTLHIAVYGANDAIGAHRAALTLILARILAHTLTLTLTLTLS
jgi:hypothetical protein